MDSHQILFFIALMLVSARLFSEVARRFNIPTIIGELAAGIVLGPTLLGWIEPNEVLRLLAEIGIILLLFEVGLETDIEKLIKAGPQAVTLALAGFVLPFLLGFCVTYYLFNLSFIISLFVGGTLTATSIGVTVRILSSLGRHRSIEGQIVLGAAVIDDVLGVLLLAILYEFVTIGTVSAANAGSVILFVVLFFILAPVFAKIVSLQIKRYQDLTNTPGFIPVMLVALVLLMASFAHQIGAPELLGGFAAGIALSRRFIFPFAVALKADEDFTRRIGNEMRPIIQLFTPLFFVMVGLSLDLSVIDWSSVFIWSFSLSLVAVAIFGKLMAGWLLPASFHRRTVIGMAMVPRGEVGLIFAELGRTAGILVDEVFAGLIIVIAYTTLLAPFWIKWYYSRYGEKISEE